MEKKTNPVFCERTDQVPARVQCGLMNPPRSPGFIPAVTSAAVTFGSNPISPIQVELDITCDGKSRPSAGLASERSAALKRSFFFFFPAFQSKRIPNDPLIFHIPPLDRSRRNQIINVIHWF